ncbi:hypothetical protein ABT382_12645 [Streptomyces pharetrae]|uniref:hypothetical protein n=1 Tax=Streptomyces pharetrae TaxID=291370 RepID=UPI00334DAB78
MVMPKTTTAAGAQRFQPRTRAVDGSLGELPRGGRRLRSRFHRHPYRCPAGPQLFAGPLEEVLEQRTAAGGDDADHARARDRPVHPEGGGEFGGQVAATALPATWGTLRSIRFCLTSSSDASEFDSRTRSGFSRIPGPCLPFPHQIDLAYERGTYDRDRQFRFW